MTIPSRPRGQFGPFGQQAPPPWDPRGFSGPVGGPPGGQHPGGPGGPMIHGPGPYLPGPQQSGYPGGPSGPPGAHPAAPKTGHWVLVLRIAALVLVALGLSIPFDSSCDWAARTTWAIFAIVAAVAQLLSSTGGSFGWDVRRSWLIGAVATGALTLHWLLIALPNVGSNAGFCLTFGTAAAIGGMLLAPGRRW
ncbi:hypothetical protein ABLG96_12285 [Nakamurella sp. A5-74]|uniref:Integral membrane protein n=1 Tax=Nakamurella sp. A5-74 TaxID=3158264 RepID=A0AAU8DJU2_9ACTN